MQVIEQKYRSRYTAGKGRAAKPKGGIYRNIYVACPEKGGADVELLDCAHCPNKRRISFNKVECTYDNG